VTLVTACGGGRERANVLTAHGEQEVVVMDFSAPFPLDPLPAGWYHRTFWTRGPMQMAFAARPEHYAGRAVRRLCFEDALCRGDARSSSAPLLLRDG
jgi:hypothetical protein